MHSATADCFLTVPNTGLLFFIQLIMASVVLLLQSHFPPAGSYAPAHGRGGSCCCFALRETDLHRTQCLSRRYMPAHPRILPIPPPCSPYAESPAPHNSAKYDRINSRRRTAIDSGPDSAFLRIMTSIQQGGEGNEVQRGTIRARFFQG
jgi:hypothetical protein